MTEPNVVQFPRSKIVREASPPDIEELIKVKERGIKSFADTVVSDVTSNLLADLDNYGIDIENEGFIKDFHFFIATLTATVYRTLDVEHPLHDFMDDHVVIVPMDQELPKDEEVELVLDEDLDMRD